MCHAEQAEGTGDAGRSDRSGRPTMRGLMLLIAAIMLSRRTGREASGGTGRPTGMRLRLLIRPILEQLVFAEELLIRRAVRRAGVH